MMSNGHSNSSKSLERFISRRALQMGSSAPCKTWALGFFCGVCIVYLFGVALPPIQILMIRSVHPPVRRAILLNSTSTEPGILRTPFRIKNSVVVQYYMFIQAECIFSFPFSCDNVCVTSFFHAGGATETDDLSVLQEKIEIATNSKDINEADKMHLYNAWSTLLDTNSDEVMKSSDVPRPPHLENCRLKWERNKKFDSYSDNGVFPPWTLWKGSLGLELFNQNYSDSEEWRQMFFRSNAKSDRAPYPPWVCKLA